MQIETDWFVATSEIAWTVWPWHACIWATIYSAGVYGSNVNSRHSTAVVFLRRRARALFQVSAFRDSIGNR